MSGLSDANWNTLLRRIEQGNCTPFLGAAVNLGILPLGGEIAKGWAAERDYPLADCWDLPRVSQYLGIQDPMEPKESMVELLGGAQEKWLRDTSQDEFWEESHHPLAVLARMPFRLYMTTNYDDLIVRGLRRARHGGEAKQPRQVICTWNKYIRRDLEDRPELAPPDVFAPTPEAPIVYHLHGSSALPSSLVLTESDYLDFLVNIGRELESVLQPGVQEDLAQTSLLFMGYSLADWNFRVLLRGVVESVRPATRRASVAVQLPPELDPTVRDRALTYLGQYFGSIGNTNVAVYWGDVMDFARELEDRWKDYKKAG